MVTTKFEARPNVLSLHYDNGVMHAKHTDSTVEITLEYVNDDELQALFHQFMFVPEHVAAGASISLEGARALPGGDME
jgi:hypothetical protein